MYGFWNLKQERNAAYFIIPGLIGVSYLLLLVSGDILFPVWFLGTFFCGIFLSRMKSHLQELDGKLSALRAVEAEFNSKQGDIAALEAKISAGSDDDTLHNQLHAARMDTAGILDRSRARLVEYKGTQHGLAVSATFYFLFGSVCVLGVISNIFKESIAIWAIAVGTVGILSSFLLLRRIFKVRVPGLL